MVLAILVPHHTRDFERGMQHRRFGDDGWQLSEANALSTERKVAVVYTLLAACVTDSSEEGASGSKAGYDARQRVALRLIALWLDLDWIKVVSFPVLDLAFQYLTLLPLS